MQKQSHVEGPTDARHSSAKLPSTATVKHADKSAVVDKLCPKTSNYFPAPVAPKGRRMRRLLCALDIPSWAHGWRNLPPADPAVTQAAPPARKLCLCVLDVAWSPRHDPCAQRDARRVAWLATGFADGPAIGES